MAAIWSDEVMTCTSLEDVALAFVRAINKQDLKAMEELMAPNHRFIDSRGNAITGRHHVRVGWQHYFHLAHDYTIEVQESFCKGPVAVLTGVAQGSYTIDGKLERDERWSIPAAFRAFIEDGKIVEWRVFADHEPLRKHLRHRDQDQSRSAGNAA